MFLEEKELLETQQNQDLEEDRQISFDRARSSAASSFPSIGEGYPARWGFFFSDTWWLMLVSREEILTPLLNCVGRSGFQNVHMDLSVILICPCEPCFHPTTRRNGELRLHCEMCSSCRQPNQRKRWSDLCNGTLQCWLVGGKRLPHACLFILKRSMATSALSYTLDVSSCKVRSLCKELT